MPRLVVIDGCEGLEPEYRFGERISLGRSSDCDLPLEHAGVSRLHATITFKDGKAFLTDEKSHNGTFVNGTRVDGVEVRSGDTILVGQTTFRFEADTPSGEKPAEVINEAPAPKEKSSPSGSRRERKITEDTDSSERSDKGSRREQKITADTDSSERSDKGSRRDRKTNGEATRSSSKDKSTRRERRNGESTRTRPAGGQILGGARLSANQQLAVKIGSAVFSGLCIIGIVYLASNMGAKSSGGSASLQPIKIDPLARPRELSAEAIKLAQEAKEIEDGGDWRKAYELLSQARDKINEASDLMTEISLLHPGEGHRYVEREAVRINSHKGAISQQWVRLEIRKAVRDR